MRGMVSSLAASAHARTAWSHSDSTPTCPQVMLFASAKKTEWEQR